MSRHTFSTLLKATTLRFLRERPLLCAAGLVLATGSAVYFIENITVSVRMNRPPWRACTVLSRLRRIMSPPWTRRTQSLFSL
ncbi:hypothetical protein J4Q44_G00048320 [Coregonus suidteri]|uniref:Uncharacterized protein n=1 Tax=Coregonus suidteri TaxID=861788 RepID=A0AAN8R207_9TELE